jgi:hypothetical protein
MVGSRGFLMDELLNSTNEVQSYFVNKLITRWTCDFHGPFFYSAIEHSLSANLLVLEGMFLAGAFAGKPDPQDQIRTRCPLDSPRILWLKDY